MAFRIATSIVPVVSGAACYRAPATARLLPRASKLTPEIVSAKIYFLLTSDKKPLRVPMDKAKAVTLLKRFAPQAMINKLVNGLVGSTRNL